MAYTFILEKEEFVIRGYINEFPNEIIVSTCITSLKLKLKTKLKKIVGSKLKNTHVRTIIKFN